MKSETRGLGYTLLSLAFTGIVVATVVAVSPVVGTVFVLAFAAGWFLAMRPKLLAFIAVLGVTFSRTVERVGGISALGYLDEGLIVFCCIVFVCRRLGQGQPLRGIAGGSFFLAFLAFGLASAVLNNVPNLLAAQGAFLSAKGLILAWSIAQVNWSSDDLRRGIKPLAWVVAVLLVGAMINLVVPQMWANIFQTLGYVQYRIAGLPSLISVTTHPLDFGALATFSAIGVAAYRTHVRKSPANAVLFWGSAVSTLLTFRRASIAALVSVLSLEPLKRFKTGAVIFGSVMIPILVLVTWQGIEALLRNTYTEYFLNPDGTARTVLTRDAFSVAAEYFPFGAGFSRFGSFLAGVEYSPEYSVRGYDKIYGMGPGEKGRFLTDTQWPAIIGESGFIGSACFLIGIALVIRMFWLLRTEQDAHIRWLSVTGVGWIISISVMSIAAPAFYSSTFFAAVFGLIGVAAGLEKSKQPDNALDRTRSA